MNLESLQKDIESCQSWREALTLLKGVRVHLSASWGTSGPDRRKLLRSAFVATLQRCNYLAAKELGVIS